MGVPQLLGDAEGLALSAHSGSCGPGAEAIQHSHSNLWDAGARLLAFCGQLRRLQLQCAPHLHSEQSLRSTSIRFSFQHCSFPIERPAVYTSAWQCLHRLPAACFVHVRVMAAGLQHTWLVHAL